MLLALARVAFLSRCRINSEFGWEEMATKMKCAEPNCTAEIGGIAGQIGTGRRCKKYCMKHYREHAKHPPPFVSDIASELMRSKSGGITTKKGKEVLK